MAEGRSDARIKGNRLKEITLSGREGKIVRNSHDWAVVDVPGEGWAFFNLLTVNKTSKFHIEDVSKCFPVGSVVRLNARMWLDPEGSVYTNEDVRSCKWIVNSVKSKPDLIPLPVMFKTAFNFDNYNVPPVVLSEEKVGEAIFGIMKRLKVINGLPVTQLVNTFKNESSNIPLDVRTMLCDTGKLRTLVQCLPRYFLVTDDRVFIYACREKEEVDIEIESLIPEGWRPNEPICVNVGHNTHIIENPADCAAVVEEILSGPKPVTIALDCEGESLGKTGKLTLLQMSTWSGQAYLVDVLAILEPNQFFVGGGLKKLLESPDVIKVIHDCRADNAALYHQYDVSLTNVFDTAVAYTVIMEQCHANRSNGGSLEHLCELFSKPLVTKTKQMKKKMAYVKGFWSRRPMTPEMIRYAAVDALSLVPHVYVNMKRLIHTGWQSRYDTLITEKLLKRK
ncbi:uncharacterized protein LOC117107884 [Anneissia japonica]|uniref:uncharacterized protein LOC117107884 n=1 Tax=Anneissia japonica TaxID=1529436 RepID=UPI0014257D76|nr:uncharacterized protein LOC117107884 [Anneissia japonica]XP_033105610.1 uncharacterized protein LOC117107884 [Anneissia japonica]